MNNKYTIIKNNKTYNIEYIDNSYHSELRRGKMVEKLIGRLYKSYEQTDGKDYYDLKVVDNNNEELLIEVKADHSAGTYNFGTMRFTKTKAKNKDNIVEDGFLYDLTKVDRFVYVRFNKEIYNKVDYIFIFDSKKLYERVMKLEEERPDTIMKCIGDKTRQNQYNKNNYQYKEIHYIPIFKRDNNNEYIVNDYFKDTLVECKKSNFIFNYMMTNKELGL